jgi:hypothetical protein
VALPAVEEREPEPVDRAARERDLPLGVVLAAVCAGIIAVLLFVTQFSFEEALSVAGVAALVAGSTLAVGAAIGFLFGIPRTLQDEQRSGAGTTYRDNTNLEQISDWLTKILVGVGLTQITRAPSELRSLAEFLEPGLGGVAGSEAFALTITIYYTTLGFFLGYLWTRVYLAGLLYSADRRIRDLDRKVDAVVERAETEARYDVTALGMVDAILNPARGAPQPSEEDLRENLKKASPSVRVQALLRAQEMRSNSWRDDKERMERTLPILRALTETPEADTEHMIHGQYGFALKDQRNPDWAGAERELGRAMALRGDWRQHGWLFYEFNRAVARINGDTAFQQDLPSSPEVKQRILEDLREIAQDEYLLGLIERGEGNVKDWMEINSVTIDELK